MTGTCWVAQTSVTKSATPLLGLVSGSRQWVRVGAVGSAGTGGGVRPLFLNAAQPQQSIQHQPVLDFIIEGE